MIKKLLIVSNVLLFNVLNMSALTYVDLGMKVGVGLDLAHYANFGESVHTFYDQTKLKGLVAHPSFGIHTDLWFTERIALSINFNANFNRGGNASYVAKDGENQIEVWVLEAMRTLWEIESGTQGSIKYRYHSLSLDVMAKTALKWWYIGAGAGLAVHLPSKVNSTVDTFQFNKMIWGSLMDKSQNNYQLTSSDVKATLGVNLVLESGVNIPIHQNGFLNLGGRLRYDVLARAKKYDIRDRPLLVSYYQDGNLPILTAESYIARDMKNLFDKNTISFGSPLTLDFFVGYTYRFNMK